MISIGIDNQAHRLGLYCEGHPNHLLQSTVISEYYSNTTYRYCTLYATVVQYGVFYYVDTSTALTALQIHFKSVMTLGRLRREP